MEIVKVYVDVTAEFSKEGVLTPKSFIWKDGSVYEIQRVKDMRRAASMKAGGVGMRYTCVIEGQDKYLFYEDILCFKCILFHITRNRFNIYFCWPIISHTKHS